MSDQKVLTPVFLPFKSWAPEVIADNSGKWCGNGLRFATQAEAEANAEDLHSRWTLVREHRAVQSVDPVNYKWDPAVGLIQVTGQ